MLRRLWIVGGRERRSQFCFKRGMIGTYQHCGEQHLQRYLNEFDFRYSNRIKLGITDDMRADKALEGIKGKRLTYRRING